MTEWRKGNNRLAPARARGGRTRSLTHLAKTASVSVLLGLVVTTVARAAPAASVAHGAYLAAAAGCDQCHTDSDHHARPYAGGRAFETRFGTVYSPNITPDPQTGIGRWRFADFEFAMRWGIAPDDSHYMPIFPFPFYDRLTAEDVIDLKAFLDTVPAVAQTNRADGAGILSADRARAAIEVIATPFSGPWRPDPSKSAEWNRGAYLVATVGRCGDCHTPRNRLGARELELALSGASAAPGGKAVPNITPDRETGIGKWSEQDIVNLLTIGQTPDFDFVGGAMGEIVKNTSRLDDADRLAIAVYLKSVPAIRSPRRAR